MEGKGAGCCPLAAGRQGKEEAGVQQNPPGSKVEGGQQKGVVRQRRDVRRCAHEEGERGRRGEGESRMPPTAWLNTCPIFAHPPALLICTLATPTCPPCFVHPGPARLCTRTVPVRIFPYFLYYYILP